MSNGNIEICQAGHHLWVDGSPDVLSHPCFRARRIELTNTPAGIHRAQRQSVPLFDDLSGRARAGFLHVLRKVARDRNYRVQLTGRAPVRLGTPSRVSVPDQMPPDVALPQFFANHERGLVRFDREAVSLPRLIWQVCASYPDKTIAVVDASHRDVRLLKVALQRLGLDLSRRIENCFRERVLRIATGTVLDFAEPDLELEKRDIVIFARARITLHKNAVFALISPDCRFRVFGFAGQDESFSEAEQVDLRGAFGFAELQIPRHGWERTLPTVCWISSSVKSARTPLTGECTHRQTIWRNEERNLAIAKLARHEATRVKEHGDDSDPPRLVVLTASVEHAFELAKYLRNWPILRAMDAILEGATPQIKRKLAAAEAHVRSGGGGKMIATVAGLERLPMHRAGQVLLWAGSSPSGPAIPDHHLKFPQSETWVYPRTILVDVKDSTPPLRRWAGMRRESYRELDFAPFRLGPTDGRIANYIKRMEATAR